MRFLSCFAIGSLLASVTPAWADGTDNNPVGTWTISNVRRVRSPDNTTCNWSFTLTASEVDDGQPPAQCAFTVQGTPELGCDKRDLGDAPCTDGVTQYAIGGGWSDKGFVVISIVNPDENAQAYFGYSDTALNNRTDAPLPPQDKKAFRISSEVTSRRRHQRAIDLYEKRDSGKVEDATKWKISTLVRVVNQDDRWLYLGFTIEDDKQNQVPCNLHIEGPVNTNMSTWSWYDKKCIGSGWGVSMGYMNETDSGIMTLVSPARNRQAFFGFPKINTAQDPMSAGPAPVSSCNCA
ncbi:Transcriptional regulator WAR1 [Apiospora arundinis]|uniref:Small secreted protein n=1 Tax=Apiospora arundinis TaxID=335852 RepID=A0ABR2I8P9_9PEZI